MTRRPGRGERSLLIDAPPYHPETDMAQRRSYP